MLIVYVGIRHAMAPMLPRHSLVLSSLVRRAHRALPGGSGSPRLLLMAPSRQYVVSSTSQPVVDDMRSAHINNVNNTVFWALVQQGGQTTKEAHETLRVCLPATSYFCF